LIKYFKTKNGISVPAITTKQMIEVDRIAIEETGPNLFQMMENAGRNLAELTIEILGENWQSSEIIVLAGTGGNGGGGICTARHLANRNANVILCLSNSERLGEVPAYQRKIFQSTYGKEIEIDNLKQLKPDLIIDAIIGYNLNSAPRQNTLKMINWANQQKTMVLSLDVPSGVNSTTGETYGKFINADRTLTLALPKTGLLPELTGELFLADLGIPVKVYETCGIKYSNPFVDKYFIKIDPSQKQL